MFITPYFGGCKYTNNFLFINNNIEIQYFDLLKTQLPFSCKHHNDREHGPNMQKNDSFIHKFLYIWKLSQEKLTNQGLITNLAMETDRKWIVVRIDGKIAAISKDYRLLAEISARIAAPRKTGKARKDNDKSDLPYQKIAAEVTSFNEVWKMRQEALWEDLMLLGTEFQKKVWRKLWELTHTGYSDRDIKENDLAETRLISYSDFAELCQNRAGVRAVAHAIGLNPISVVIPCHLVIPKESIDKMRVINKKAEATIFKGDDLCLSSILKNETIDFGNYALGPALKRELIFLELLGPEL